MNKFKKLKKALALVLVFCMVMGSIPATAFASTEKEPIDAAVIFTDLHTNKSDYKESTINGIFGALKKSGLPFSSVTSGGDAFSVNADSDWPNGKYTGYTSKITGYINSVLEDVPVSYVWSDHDRYALQEDDKTLLDKTSHLSYGAGVDGTYGTDDDSNYYVYSLSMGDLSSFDRYNAGFSSNRVANGYTESIDKAIENFKSDMATLKKDRPLFVVSHQPLFDRRNDNAFAEQWFDAINEVAENMDVAFFFGHNHKYDEAGDYYYAKGSTMPVATKDKWTSYAVNKSSSGVDLSSRTKTLNFTHMCAGYMEPTSTRSYNNTTTRKSVAMAVAIYEDTIQFTTYDKNGVYTGNYRVNESVKRAHKPVIEEPETPVVPEDTELTVGRANVVVSGAKVNESSQMSTEDQALIDEKNYEDVIGLDIDATIINEKATLKFTVPNDWEDKTDRIVGISSENGELKEIEGEYANGFFTFDVEHFSAKGIAVKAANPTIENITLSKNVGKVERGKNNVTDAFLNVLHSGEDSARKVDITIDMISGTYNFNANGTYTGLTLTYNEQVVTKEFTLVVTDVAGKNYPEYPEEGSVKVNKTATGVQFQSTGVAQVEISASGIPVKKGADLIIMLDTSSSMKKNEVTGSGGKMRSTVLEESLSNLIKTLKTPNENGEFMDINVAIADFNGYYGDNSGGTSNTPYDRTRGDYVKNGNSNGSGYSQPSEAKVYTGNNTLGAGAFVKAQNLANSYTLNYTSGTNYDYAFDAIYQLGTAAKNASDEERDLFVIFMSDGASLQWNYFGTQNGYTKWNYWLAGKWDADDLTTTNLNSTAHSYFYDLNDYDNDGQLNEHRMANAIKGYPGVPYEVIRKSESGLPSGTLTKVAKKDYLYTVPGLGAKIFTINFDAKQDGQITADNIDRALSSTASDQTGTTKYYYKVTTAEQLNHAFDSIGSEISYAATNARYVDQMGNDFNLHMTPVVDMDNNPIKDKDGNQILPSIDILSYEIYTKEEADRIPEGTTGDDVTENMVGQRKGTVTTLETVTFESEKNSDGSYKVVGAYSNQIDGGETNILGEDGIINAKTFFYNSNTKPVTISSINIPSQNGSATNVLPAETFYWKMGTVQSNELAMRYYVYLEDSMEGRKDAGSYPTNEYAILYYDNYLGNACEKQTTSPVMPWQNANVSYAFYLVNEKGEIIVNQTTGQTGSFANRVTIAGPRVYESILMNSKFHEMNAYDVAQQGLPDEYELYDAVYDANGVIVNTENVATYSVMVNSDYTGAWKISSTKPTQTTYVTNYDTSKPTAFSNALEMKSKDHDYTHTTVWFAVTVGVEANPDTVVVDYGLPVDISVLENDRFVKRGTLAGVGPIANANLGDFNPNTDTTMAEGFATEYNGTKYGKVTANLENGKVRYTPSNMKMNGYDKFAYAVNYSAYINSGYYYDTVTVIPATTIYYEDSFVDFKVYEKNVVDENAVWNENQNETWLTVTDYKVNSDVTQAEDRPGLKNSELNGLYDADNVYGYDRAYDNMSTYSLGSARKITVDEIKYGTATFDFWGTGFDVIALTSNTTGTITVQVQKVNADNSLTNVKNYIVDTYYGYTRDENGNWVVNQNAANSLYQVPVIETANIGGYGHYKVTIKAAYGTLFDHVKESTAYDLYIDAIRIYDPANDGANDEIIKDAYIKDGEYLPEYVEVRNELIAANDFYNLDDNTNTNGIIFIDGSKSNEEVSVEDYKKYGPNNEVYLKSKQSIAFDIRSKTNVKDIQIGLKSADGNPVDYSISGKKGTLNTSTGMYYSILEQSGETIVITNTSENDSILSVTDIKFTYAEDVAIEPSSMIFSSRSTLNNAKKIMTEDPKVYSVTTDKETYVPGETVEVTVKTNKATTAVTVNGEDIEEFREKGNDRYWTFKNTADSLGELEFTVVAYNELNEETDVVNTEVMVEKFVPKTFKLSLDKTSALVKDKVKATVTTSDDVEDVTINGYKVTKYTYNKVNKTKTWSATFNMNTLGERTLKAVAYDKYGNAADSVSKTVTVKEFAPKTFKLALSKTTAVVKDKVKATVTTSDDVKYVTINGYKTTKYTYNKTNKTKTWTMEFKLNTLGKRTIKAVAYNTNGSASNAVSKSLTVKNFAPKTFKVSLDKSKIKKGAKYTVTVTTSSTVKYVTVNGKKVTKNTYSSKTGLRTFKVTCTAENTGKRTVKVYAFNTNGAKSALKTNALTVTKK